MRFDWPTRQRLQTAANRFGQTKCGIIRFAVLQQLAAIESGVIHLTEQPGFAQGVTPGRPEPEGVKPT